MLTLQERAEIKGLIIAQIELAELEISNLKEKMEPVSPDSSIGRLSRMDSLVNQETAALSYSAIEQRLNRLKGKLARIDDSDFGRCGCCGAMISMGRLRAAPDRGSCLECLSSRKR